MGNEGEDDEHRRFAILFSHGGHTACWYEAQGSNVALVFGAALKAWLIHWKRPVALLAVELKESGSIREDGVICGFDDRTSDNSITYYTRAGMKRVSA